MSVNGKKSQNFSQSPGRPEKAEASATPAVRREPAWFRNSVAVVALVAIALAFVPWYSAYLQDKSLRKAGQGFQIDSLHTAQDARFWNPFSVNALFVLAGADQRIGWQQDARENLEKATKLEPQNYATWEALAIDERDDWKMPGRAAADFAHAVALNPQDKELRQAAELPAPSGS